MSGTTHVISLDPVTRIEGHLKAEVTVENGRVTDARMVGGMYRGFESILAGRDPADAPQIVQRICGVCPVSHDTAACLALEDAAKTAVPPNGRIARNLMLAANYLQSNILHFYHLAGQDYFRGSDTAPFIPRYARPDLRLPPSLNTQAVEQYLEALEVRQVCHEMVALLGGRMPHVQGMPAGGAAQIPTKETILEYAGRMKRVRDFAHNRLLPLAYAIAGVYRDLFDMAHGYGDALCAGAFPLDDTRGGKQAFRPGLWLNGRDAPFDPSLIREDTRHAWFTPSPEDSGALFPPSGPAPEPDPDKKDAYTFVKAPSYAGRRLEVGPAARMWINDTPLSAVGRERLPEVLGTRAETVRDMGADNVFSLMGRQLTRAEEVHHTIGLIEGWLRELTPGEPTFLPPDIPEEADGMGFTEAPRGALGHAVRIRNGRIERYAVLAASMWNFSPRDAAGQRGPVEEALIGVPVPDPDSPVNVGRVIRAFDP